MSGRLFKQIEAIHNQNHHELTESIDEATLETINDKARLIHTIQTCESISKLASIVRLDWDKVYFGAVPYLQTMRTLETKEDMYGLDSATSVVVYFLSNATTWKGEVAREVKKRLKQIVEVK